jgi:hypothetical protein
VRPKHAQFRKHFTIEEANASLPLVAAIVRDLTELAREVVQRRDRLSSLPPCGDYDPDDPYQQELLQIADELEKDNRRLREYVEELLDLGVKPRSITQGVVDFPAILDGRPVYLSWKLGETEVLHWYDRDASFADRCRLGAGSSAQDQRSRDTSSVAS